jgi:hypothetical protein
MSGEPTNGPWQTSFVTDENGDKWYEIRGPHEELIAILPRDQELERSEEAANMRLIRRAFNLLVVAGMAESLLQATKDEVGLGMAADARNVIRNIRKIRKDVFGMR